MNIAPITFLDKETMDMTNEFEDCTVLITTGPTQEAIDPVRYISNHSSGKMGYAIANELLARGANVILVSGPVSLSLSHPKLKVIKVITAVEMFAASKKVFPQVDIAIYTAAVADYRPETIAPNKIKKQGDTLTLTLVKNPDIALELGKLKTKNQLAVGFALETDNEIVNATEKLQKKNLDMVVLNSLQDKDATFGHDTNKITILQKDGITDTFPLKSKADVAIDIVNTITTLRTKLH